ncbi:MAG: Cysteine desulfurase NifS [Verrucomicrobia subdivision 3 bacterium]|nr:Cysteine desulfurase NifS [Limisphaerales bacterium]MCS1413095.1 Cysteine desulfurase NifS [Limisphaerales bacterium]
MHYFDYNATTPLSDASREAWLAAVEQFPGNPSSPHRIGIRADRALAEARETLGARLGCLPLDLIWTSGATEASNLVFHHYARQLPESAVVWVSAIEHPCVIQAAETHLRGRVRRIPVTSDGVVRLEWLETQVNPPALVVVMAANNETGVLQPWEAIRDWCQERIIPFFCDAAQWLGKLPADGLGQCDWLFGCAHKFGGPKGVGFLKCPTSATVTPLMVGGPQEMSRRAGTENVAGVLAMIAALEEREMLLNAEWIASRQQSQRRIENLIRKQIPDARVIGRSAARLWNTTSLVMPDCDCRFRWVVKLDRLGFAVSTGSACASGKEKPSHVLEAMQCTPGESSRVIRCSGGPETTEKDWEALVEASVQVDRQARV